MSLSISGVTPANYLTGVTGTTASQRTASAKTFREINPAMVATCPQLGNLTSTDLELVYQATGVRLDENSKTFPMFAEQIATDRLNGGIKPGQNVSEDYLRNLIALYQGSTVDLGKQAQTALDYLHGRGGQHGINVLA